MGGDADDGAYFFGDVFGVVHGLMANAGYGVVGEAEVFGKGLLGSAVG